MITLLGATGYTGRLVAAELAGRGLPLRLAGRSAPALQALADGLPGKHDVLVANLADAATLPALAVGTTLLVSCAGPFTDLGEPVAALAARHGLRYLDTTNELAFVYDLYRRLGPLAQASGATLVPACAFEVALADCAAALLAAELGAQPLDAVAITYRLPGAGSSYGTRASALRSLATSWLAYRDGAYGAVRPGTTAGRVLLADTTVPVLAFPSSETATLPAHLTLPRVDTWMVVSATAARYGPVLLPALAGLLRGPLGTVLGHLARRAAPPPTPRARAAMPFSIGIVALAGAAQASLTLHGHDPYGLTARIVAYAAKQLLAGTSPHGVVPPALLLPPAIFLETLRDEGWLSIQRSAS